MAAHYPLGADIEITHVGYSSGGTTLGCISFEHGAVCRVIATQVLLRKAALIMFYYMIESLCLVR
jgi:hypothetical protein